MRIMFVRGRKDDNAEFFLKNLHHQKEVSKYEMPQDEAEAMERLWLQNGEFDVIITDIDTASLTNDHLMLVREVRENFPSMICIIRSENDLSAEAERLGALFFFKSFDLRNLLGMAIMAKDVRG